ncbi:lipocalin family protein [Methylotenera sp. N17]|uniref:lipocalin family protein n=1 Tax=Methylotenera sp. N17 TaxID=1502761 RepID=UPI00064869CF|nr:lipocalin family protein [Methylotenera sp. N17]
MNKILSCLLLCIPMACMGVPDNVKVVDNVDASQYLGTWYEIARLDHSFERGLEQVTANYSKNEDGSIKVINRGYNPIKNEWEEAEGKAYFTEAPNKDGSYKGKLKVSFFGPFYGAYNIMELDKPYYNYVMVCGPDKSYLWILSRTPQLTYPIKQELMSKAKALGFETDNLIHVNQVPDTRVFKAGPHVN